MSELTSRFSSKDIPESDHVFFIFSRSSSILSAETV